MTEFLPCPFCGGEIKHIESWAKSFQPNRLYHEWHHPEIKCRISGIIESADEKIANQEEAARRWNTRAPGVAQTGQEIDLLIEALQRAREVVWAVVAPTHSISFDADLRAIDLALEGVIGTSVRGPAK